MYLGHGSTFSLMRHTVPLPVQLELMSQHCGPIPHGHLKKPGQCSAWLSRHFLACSQARGEEKHLERLLAQCQALFRVDLLALPLQLMSWKAQGTLQG